jgi:hypothetical protein
MQVGCLSQHAPFQVPFLEAFLLQNNCLERFSKEWKKDVLASKIFKLLLKPGWVSVWCSSSFLLLRNDLLEDTQGHYDPDWNHRLHGHFGFQIIWKAELLKAKSRILTERKSQKLNKSQYSAKPRFPCNSDHGKRTFRECQYRYGIPESYYNT